VVRETVTTTCTPRRSRTTTPRACGNAAVSSTIASYEPGRACAGGRADTVTATGLCGRRRNRRGRIAIHLFAELVARGKRAAVAVTASALPRALTMMRREPGPSTLTRTGDAAIAAAPAIAAINARPP